jgi:UDP-N-acetylmuramyl pentapeptide phosphotransferase/UDP-N-acetylglucosamine-1-phosphate transferase
MVYSYLNSFTYPYPHFMTTVIWMSVVLLVISFLLTWQYKKYSLKKNILDVPNMRSSHSSPTPRGGGVAIVISWYLGITALFFLNRMESNLYYALLCGVLIAAVSLIDDIFSLRPWLRLLIMFISSTAAIIIVAKPESLSVTGVGTDLRLLIYPVTIIGSVWFINVFNFLDGIDGYASIEAIMVASVLFFFTGSEVNVILIVSVLGFLFWNWPRAKIFMGDVGSTQLGFIIAILGIYFHSTNQFSIISWFILLSPFWFDATLTLYRRWRNKEKLSEAHRKHIYQRFVQSGLSHLQVDMFLVLMNTIIFFVVLGCHKWPELYLPFLFATLTFLYLITLYADKKKPF